MQLLRNPSTGSCGWSLTEQSSITSGTPADFTPVNEVPARHKVIGCQFVRTWKGNEVGAVVRPKSRLLALGYSQTEYVNYFETFSPTPSPSSIKLIT